MKLIADSGSSKADWVAISGTGDKFSFKTRGINPFHRTRQEILEILSEDFPPHFDFEAVKEVFFYGAGCASDMCSELERTFSLKFIHARTEAASDLLGAARGFWRHDPGVICVLGTGASCCAYDGAKIIQQSNSLGYVMGDEGGGADIGKRVVRKFFYNELSEEFAKELREKGLCREEFLRQVYKSERPAAYLANFVQYLPARKHSPEVQEILREAFQEYIDHHIRVVRRESMGVGFIGSVAYLFSDILEDLMAKNHLPFRGVIRYPIDALCEYHI